jgi:hypothetical protein
MFGIIRRIKQWWNYRPYKKAIKELRKSQRHHFCESKEPEDRSCQFRWKQMQAFYEVIREPKNYFTLHETFEQKRTRAVKKARAVKLSE